MSLSILETFLHVLNSNLVPSSSAEILSSGLTLHIHLTIFASFLSSQITSSSSTVLVYLRYSITLHTLAKYSLSLALEGKPLLTNKGNKSLILHHPPLILVVVKCTTSSSYCVAKVSKHFLNFKRLTT